MTILFPTDYSPCSIAALQHACALARSMSARLLVLHVAPPGALQVGAEAFESGHGSEEKDLPTLVANLSRGDQSVDYEHCTLVGDPVSEILELARREVVDLIVMGTTGRTGLKRLLMGSVAEAVVRGAPCPVLTLSQTAAAHAIPVPPLADGSAESFSPTPESIPPAQPTYEDSTQRLSSPALDLLTRAVTASASDIHIDPVGKDFEVRVRIDGRIRHFCRLSGEVGHSLITQLKVLGNLNIADPFHCKEGRLRLPAALAAYEVRLTVLRVTGGEAASLRLFSRDRLLRPLDELGLSAESLSLVQRMLKLGEGLILVTGPSGSGKTTTAYSMLQALDNGENNIVTLEDPVEVYVPSFRQIDVDRQHGITMTMGLRALLRLDPDVVLLGEIRDPEAADTAMRAASSGKYVFSTFHTRDVASTVTALRDLSVDNRSMAGNLTGIISQRLVRRVCRECCRREKPTEEELAMFVANGVEPPHTLVKAVGCAHCHGMGYRGRIGVFEIILPTPELVQKMIEGVPEKEIRSELRATGTPSLLVDGMIKAREGLTTFDEICKMSWVELL